MVNEKSLTVESIAQSFNIFDIEVPKHDTECDRDRIYIAIAIDFGSDRKSHSGSIESIAQQL